MIDYGPESHLMWVVFMDADGACWTVPNPEIRMQANWSMQRRPSRKPFQTPAAPIVVPPAEEAPALNGHGALNGHSRYDAAPSGT
jgi:hypothetical protein